jgi:hypothetical protein
MSYLEERMKFIEDGRPLPEKKKYKLKPVSDKRAAKEKEQKAAAGDDGMDKFFEKMRKRMVGVCQCGCARKSSKLEDDHYRASICHIFPKRLFLSITTNELNWVERNFWDGCHSNMDNRSMDRWTMFADWEDIKERFHTLAPFLTDEERSTKFYSHLEKLVYAK